VYKTSLWKPLMIFIALSKLMLAGTYADLTNSTMISLAPT
jgi:hypothetical protein